MNCNEISEKLSLYIDNELSSEEMFLIEEHLKTCKNCQKELEEYNNLISILRNLPEEEPPEGYCQRLHDKLVEVSAINEIEEISKTKKRANRFKWMKYGSIAAALVLVFIVYGAKNMGMGSKNYDSYDMAQSSQSMPMEMAEAPAAMEGENHSYSANIEEETSMERGVDDMAMISAAEREMKIVKTGTIYTQTEDYDIFLNDLSVRLNSLGGFIENNNTEVYQAYNNEELMYGSLKIRVPQENFYEMIDFLESNTEVRRKNINESDMTKEFYEKDNKVKNLEIQEEHLRELFERADTVEEILQIENELRRIRTEIDALNISLRDINDRVSMSTINVEVEEIATASLSLKPKDNVWDRSKDGFISTVNDIVRALENIFVNIVSSAPILLPVIIISIVIFLKIKKYWRNKI